MKKLLPARSKADIGSVLSDGTIVMHTVLCVEIIRMSVRMFRMYQRVTVNISVQLIAVFVGEYQDEIVSDFRFGKVTYAG